MTAFDDDLLLAVSEAIASVVRRDMQGTIQVGDMAQAAVNAVRRHDAAKVVSLRPRALSVGWDDTQKAALHMPESAR